MKTVKTAFFTLLVLVAMLVVGVSILLPKEQIKLIVQEVASKKQLQQAVAQSISQPSTLVPTIDVQPNNEEGFPTQTTADTPEATPTNTAPTEKVEVVEPTLSVQTRVLPRDFALVHLPAEQMEGVSFRPVEKVIVQGGSSNGTTSIPFLTGDNCNSFTKKDGVALTYLMSKRFGESFTLTGPLIGSESAFVFYEFDGPNGECVANQNNQKAPAYCAGQIYQPNGAGGQTHPEFDLYPPLEGSRASLQDPVYCIAAAMKVFKVDMGGGSVTAAANYKGFSSASDPSFKANFDPWYNAGAVGVEGGQVPFTDDEAAIRAILGPELDKWQKSIDEFYALYPNFWGH